MTFGPELEPWERELALDGGRVVIAQPPGSDTYEIEAWDSTSTDMVEMRASESQLRALHRAIGGMLSR